MFEESIDKDQTGEGDHDEPLNTSEKSELTRRDFLLRAMAVTSGLAITGMLSPRWIMKSWAQQGPVTCPPGELLQTIGEFKSSGATKTLQAVLKILDEPRTYWAPAPNGAAGMCQKSTGQMRYIYGYDPTNPSRVWPTVKGVPGPGPTLRARVGDRVQITLLNQVNVKNFPGTLDVAENGQACDENKSVGPNGSVNTYPGNPSFENPPNCFHGSSSTNLHFHGSHVSPSGIADNVLLNIRPSPMVNGKPVITEETVKPIFEKIFADCAHGHQPLLWKEWPSDWQQLQERLLKEYDKTAPWLGQPGNLPVDQQLWPQNVKAMEAMQLPQYYIGAFPTCFNIPEWNGQSTSMGQAPGTHWYHAHKHGSTTLNLANGMAGALIIEGDYDDKLKPFYKTERVLVLQQYGAVVPLLRSASAPQNADLVFVNGQYTPIVQMNPNEMQLWRFVNACHQAAVPINAAPAGLKWVQTAQDGVQFDPKNYNPDPTAPTNISFPVPAKALQVDGEWVTTGSLAPGNRIDLLVQAPSTPGTYQVTFGGKNKLLLTVKVAQDPQAAPIPNPMPFPTRAQFPAMPGFLADIRPPVGMVRREIRFNTTNTQLPGSPHTPPPQGSVGGRNPSGAQPPLFPNAPPMHTINGKQFNGEIDQYMKLGATEEWNLFNDSPSGGPAHPFHIHINPFQVIAMFDPSYMDASLKNTGVPLKEPWVWWDNFALPPGGWAKMWTRFVDFTGTYVFHCHILGHEDRGMMQMVNVSPGGTVMTHK